MKNREQIRAMNALKALKDRDIQGPQGGDVLSGFPALIIRNGLLATIAFSLYKGEGYKKVCDAIARHLADREVGLLPPDKSDVDGMKDELIQGDSEKLRLCTAEALAFLNYLRRFRRAEDKRKEESNAGTDG